MQEIIAAAMANGEGYSIPTCGGIDLKVLVPVAEGCVTTTDTAAIAQVIIIEIPKPCTGPGTGTPGYWASIGANGRCRKSPSATSSTPRTRRSP